MSKIEMKIKCKSVPDFRGLSTQWPACSIVLSRLFSIMHSFANPHLTLSICSPIELIKVDLILGLYCLQ